MHKAFFKEQKSTKALMYIGLFIGLCTLNAPLLKNDIPLHWVLAKDSFPNQPWNFLSCSFVHLSPYHFLIDVSSFFFLLKLLPEFSRWRTIESLITLGLTSSIFAYFQIYALDLDGYAGLSGINYGLLAILLLNMRSDAKTLFSKNFYNLTLLSLILKCIWEFLFPENIFNHAHLGYVGAPVSLSHFGGILSGILIYYQKIFLQNKKSNNSFMTY